MNLTLLKSQINNTLIKIQITGSKSECNRLLILQALYPQITIKNLSNSDDSKLLQKALQTIKNYNSNQKEAPEVIDIHHAGTAMRFLTAYLATIPGKTFLLTGSTRMKERPIGILVEALKQLGADIQYTENEGYPPLLINGKSITKNTVTLKANVSSQYISALLLVGSKLANGISLTLEGQITSVPYIKMTLRLLHQIGISTSFKNNVITVNAKTNNVQPQTLVVESDWSSASYWYSIVALSQVGTQVQLSSFIKNTLQGDAVLEKIYQIFGVQTHFEGNQITLSKIATPPQKTEINLDLANAPDIAQTIAVTAFGLGLKCQLTGLHTLKIKETDRLVALKNELSKFGAQLEITEQSLHLKAHQLYTQNETTHISQVSVSTYNDHRMAMAFAPLALKTQLEINNAEVVSKSYPTFWEDLKIAGFLFQNL